MIALTELQQDMLTELFNIGMGSAAASLSEMVSEEIVLSIPKIRFMEKTELSNILHNETQGHISGVSQHFNGMFSGQALLAFPTSKSMELVRLLLQDSVPLEQLTEFEEEALLEVGNIIINAGLSSLADLFNDEITSSLPTFNSGSCDDVIASTEVEPSNQQTVLFLQVDFTIETKNIEGYVVYLLDVNSIEKLAQCIESYIQKISNL